MVWVGIGAGLAVVDAMLTGQEPVSVIKAPLIVGMVGCVLGLNLVGGGCGAADTVPPVGR